MGRREHLDEWVVHDEPVVERVKPPEIPQPDIPRDWQARVVACVKLTRTKSDSDPDPDG